MVNVQDQSTNREREDANTEHHHQAYGEKRASQADKQIILRHSIPRSYYLGLVYPLTN